jgi:hypothetical protein
MKPTGNLPMQVLNLQLGEESRPSTYSNVPGTVIQADVTHMLPVPRYPTNIPPAHVAPVPTQQAWGPTYAAAMPSGPQFSKEQPRNVAQNTAGVASSSRTLGQVSVQPSFAEEVAGEKTKETDMDEDEEKKKDEEYFRKVSFFELFRYTSACDRIIIFFAIICAIGNGGVLPTLQPRRYGTVLPV